MADITTEMLDYATNGSQAGGFLARPSGDGPFPGVIVIQEWWGLNDNIKDIAQRFAAEGFAAFAPDLYHGKVTEEPDEAQKEMMALDMGRASQELVKAAEYLSQQPYINGRGIGATGFCMGGGLALTLATDTPLIKAVVPFYGANPNPIDKLADLKGPVFAVYAEHDAWISEDVRNAFTEKMDSLGKPYEIQVYPGTEHAFFNDTRPEVYRDGAAKDAWERMLALFRAEL
ncbi:MAG TPA: dienelactone hydrolase family protein [Dehalococcoidia bacterium]|nr:dienelactone hydrolase family protein [Dehalococcoidia bacterium]